MSGQGDGATGRGGRRESHDCLIRLAWESGPLVLCAIQAGYIFAGFQARRDAHETSYHAETNQAVHRCDCSVAHCTASALHCSSKCYPCLMQEKISTHSSVAHWARPFGRRQALRCTVSVYSLMAQGLPKSNPATKL